ncbi:MAG TPA: hypothetical protein VFY82_06320 [Acidimicrobiales bacterium]|nr:hypothetical protein [Acidimicrobiales bacterium]
MAIASIEYVVVGFSGDQLGAQLVPALTSLEERGAVRVLDVLLIAKDRLGDVVLRRPDQLDELVASGLAVFDTILDGRAAGLVTDLDALYAAEELAPDSTAVLIAWEPARWCVGGRGASTVVSGTAAGPIPHDLATVALDDLVSAGHPPRTAGPGAPLRARRSSRRARRPRPVSARQACGRGSGCGS